MTRDALMTAWARRAEEYRAVNAQVDGGRILMQCLSEMEGVFRAEGSEVLSLGEAARISGYSTDHLGRLVRLGTLPNVGRRHRPRVRVQDLPQKTSRLRVTPEMPNIARTSKRQIARAVVNPLDGSHDD